MEHQLLIGEEKSHTTIVDQTRFYCDLKIEFKLRRISYQQEINIQCICFSVKREIGMLETSCLLFKPMFYIIYVWISLSMTAEKALMMTGIWGINRTCTRQFSWKISENLRSFNQYPHSSVNVHIHRHTPPPLDTSTTCQSR